LLLNLAIIPAMIRRTVIEDRCLRHELEGYVRYAERVRYRLIPGVW
jgi:protein-S-isoprenylcysteine O-methyltransferase Ste14